VPLRVRSYLDSRAVLENARFDLNAPSKSLRARPSSLQSARAIARGGDDSHQDAKVRGPVVTVPAKEVGFAIASKAYNPLAHRNQKSACKAGATSRKASQNKIQSPTS
jgi:hypothetical protein